MESITGARQALTRIAGFFSELRKTAEQLTALERWYRILSQALKRFSAGETRPARPIPARGAASYGLRSCSNGSIQTVNLGI